MSVTSSKPSTRTRRWSKNALNTKFKWHTTVRNVKSPFVRTAACSGRRYAHFLIPAQRTLHNAPEENLSRVQEQNTQWAGPLRSEDLSFPQKRLPNKAINAETCGADRQQKELHRGVFPGHHRKIVGVIQGKTVKGYREVRCQYKRDRVSGVIQGEYLPRTRIVHWEGADNEKRRAYRLHSVYLW